MSPPTRPQRAHHGGVSEKVDRRGLDGVVLARELETPGERSEFYARARRGQFTRLFRGVHVDTEAWRAMTPDDRHRTMVRAAALQADDPLVFSHASAVGMWRLPWIGDWPERAHVTAPVADGGRSRAMLVRHTTGIPRDVETIDGIDVTSLARTVVDVARTQSFGCAVAVADAALRRTSHPLPGLPATSLGREGLTRELAGIPVRQGVARAHRVIEFADARADRPGESLSRVSMHVARVPKPELQVPLKGTSGRTWFVDFFWPEAGLIGEFDGKSKYSDPMFLRGRTPEQVLLDEKEREDDLRSAGHGVSRWGWALALSPARLRAHLQATGLR